MNARGRRLARIRLLERQCSDGLEDFIDGADEAVGVLSDALAEVRRMPHGHPVDASGRRLASFRCAVCRVVDDAAAQGELPYGALLRRTDTVRPDPAYL